MQKRFKRYAEVVVKLQMAGSDKKPSNIGLWTYVRERIAKTACIQFYWMSEKEKSALKMFERHTNLKYSIKMKKLEPAAMYFN